MVSVRLPSGNTYRLTWTWGISSWLFQQSTAAAPYLGRGVSSHGHHELLIAKFRLKSKKVGKTTRPFRYDLNQITYVYIVEVRNRFKGVDLIGVPDELWTEVRDTIEQTGIKTIP